jgi:hypothetical protein
MSKVSPFGPLTQSVDLVKKLKAQPTKEKLPKSKIFPFMSLPAELRNRIYEIALQDQDHHINSRMHYHRRIAYRISVREFKTLNINYPNRSCWKRWRTPLPTKCAATGEEILDPVCVQLAPVLLRVSRQIYHEAIFYLYSSPIVCLDMQALHAFLTMIGPRRRAMLRDVEVTEWGTTAAHKSLNFPAISLLADAVKLERLVLNVTHWAVSNLRLLGKSYIELIVIEGRE